MSDNTFDPKHPHEPEIPPHFDADGRCLICVMICERDNAIRERDEAREEWYSLQDAFEDSCDKIEKLERERDEAREVASGLAIQEERVEEAQKELSSIHRWIERNHPDGFIDSMTFHQNLERVTDRWYERLERVERERDEAREQNAKLREIAEKAITAVVLWAGSRTNSASKLRAELDQLK
jgi:hypothetical protein